MRFRQGIFQIRNVRDQKTYLRISLDLDRAFHADLFQLRSNLHSNQQLQADWNLYGEGAFECSIVDMMNFRPEVTEAEIKKELSELMQLHKEAMSQSAISLYE